MVSRKFFSPPCHFCDRIVLTLLSARCFLSSWHDTAPFRSCLQLPPGFLDTREAGMFAGSRTCVLFLSLLDWTLLVMTCARWFQAAYEEGPSTRC